MSLINLKKIGPEFAKKRHPEAIYTSRPLSALISICSSDYPSSNISFGRKQELEYNNTLKGLDIDAESLTSQDLNFMTQNFSTALDSNYFSELELDIVDTESLSFQDLSCTVQFKIFQPL
ncbi:unnamed protein product [Rhizophagus irregularis]|nr:unnamed protein product [Rhizophagus irregularis]